MAGYTYVRGQKPGEPPEKPKSSTSTPGIEIIPAPARAPTNPRAADPGIRVESPRIEPPRPGGAAAPQARPMKLPAGEVEAALDASQLFSSMDREFVGRMAGYFEAFEYPAGALIARSGRPAERFGIVCAGRVVVLAENMLTGEERAIEVLQQSEIFGELSALLDGAQPTTLRAETTTTTIEIAREVFMQSLRKIPGVAHALGVRLAKRLVKLSLVKPDSLPAPPPAERAASRDPRPQAASGGIPFVELADFDISEKLLQMVPARLIQEHRLLPLELRGQTMRIGMVSPKNIVALSELRRMLQSVDLEVAAISIDDFSSTLLRLKIGSVASPRGRTQRAGPEQLAFDVEDSERDAEKEIRVIGDEVVRLVNRIVAEGLNRHASDIHIESDRAGVKVRFRVAGVLDEWTEQIPPSFARGIVSRIKVLSGLDLTERRLPQDGRIGLTNARQEIDLRVSIVPAARGEKVVLRVCEAGSVLRALDQVFADERTLEAARYAINLSGGAVVVAGGTGSGKTSTLYSLIAERQRTRPETNVLMVEDPVEYRLPRATQIQVNPAVGLGFAQVLRASLRQDPDVIVCGETRDPETARMALEASISGHLMLTSMHANDTISALERLETLGCSRSLLAQGLSLVIAQRLVPRLCRACARTDTPPPMLAESLAAHGLIAQGSPGVLPFPSRCDTCQQTGYVGRIAVAELLRIDDDVKNALMSGQTANEVRDIALRGGRFHPFERAASHLLQRGLIGAADALLAVAR